MYTRVQATSPSRRFRVRATATAATALALLSLSPVAAHAFAIPVEGDDWSIRWDNTVKYSTGVRLGSRDSTIASPVTGYVNNGDRNFDRGSLILNRADIFSELDVAYRKFGLRLSGAAWYDRAYLSRNDNPGPQVAGAAPYNEFPDTVKKLHGRRAEVLDAFVYGSADLSPGVAASIRLGQHGLVWGESLVYGVNGIAGTMSPTDVVKASSVPGTLFKELVLPVPQVSGSVAMGENASVAGYYQFRWKPSRLSAAGSYFSTTDYAGPGVPPLEAKDRGQGGLAFKYQAADIGVDFGIYATRYHSKLPGGVHLVPRAGGGVNVRTFYHEGSTSLGVSASTTRDELSIGGEASIRHNVALPSIATLRLPTAAGGNTDDTASYAVGRTGHVQVNILYSLPRTALADESSLSAELAWNRLLSVQRNPAALDPVVDRDSIALQLRAFATYRQVLPGLDLTVPVGIGYVNGRSGAIGVAWGSPHKGGSYSVGLQATYRTVYNFALSYAGYYGPTPTRGPTGLTAFDQGLKDRNYLSLTASTSF